VVTEVVETTVNREMAYSYVIQLDPIVAERHQLISKYGGAVAQDMKVLWCEEEMWKDGATCSTKMYLEGSIVQVLEARSARGIGCFYAIQLDSVRAVDSMLREEHPFDVYSDAYASQAMLWEMDVRHDALLLEKYTKTIEAAVCAAQNKYSQNVNVESIRQCPHMLRSLDTLEVLSHSQQNTRPLTVQTNSSFLDQRIIKRNGVWKYKRFSRFSL